VKVSLKRWRALTKHDNHFLLIVFPCDDSCTSPQKTFCWVTAAHHAQSNAVPAPHYAAPTRSNYQRTQWLRYCSVTYWYRHCAINPVQYSRSALLNFTSNSSSTIWVWCGDAAVELHSQQTWIMFVCRVIEWQHLPIYQLCFEHDGSWFQSFSVGDRCLCLCLRGWN
jgi:hypothetical protein